MMYKPPENSNRVKIIKSKFENRSDNTQSSIKTSIDKFNISQDGEKGTSKNELAQRSDNLKPLGVQPQLSRQLSDPAKRNIKRTPAFRLDRNVLVEKSELKNRSGQLLGNVDNKIKKFGNSPPKSADNENINYKERLSRTKVETKSNFSNILNKFNGNNQTPDDNLNNKTEDSDNIVLKLLYAEAIPKSLRITKQEEEPLNALTNVNVDDDDNNDKYLINSTTLKISSVVKNTKPLSDDECYSKPNLIKNNVPAYGSLRFKKGIGDYAGLTDTLKNALKKPLPKGPAPKKPPRTFLHNSNKQESLQEIKPLILKKAFANKLNTELKNAKPTRSKGDAKYMLDKLEHALKSKGILTRKIIKGNTSEEESDNEKKHKRDLPNLPLSISSNTLYYSSPDEDSPTFNFNCLPSLGCVSSSYEKLKDSNSSFFIPTSLTSEEPVYAEPFEYQVKVEMRVKKSPDNNNGTIDGTETMASSKTIRHSVHYASSPIPDVKPGETNENLTDGDVKNQEQSISDSTFSSSPCTSDMDSMVSTPSEERKVLVSGVNVKDVVKAIERNKSINPSAICNTNSDEDRVKKLETQLKNTLDRSFPNCLASERNVCRNVVRKKENLFHCCLLVALNRCTPYIKSKFPQNVEVPMKIADLCFPEVENGPMDTSVKAQCYSLIITNEMGERTFGYCRRVLPEASTACLPIAYCILSKHRAPGFYRKILEELEFRHGYPDKFIDAFLDELYNCKFPSPGETIVINCARIISHSGCDKPINDGSIKSKGCDKQRRENLKEDRFEGSLNSDSDLDLNSYVFVSNTGEYGTLLCNNRQNNLNFNMGRGTSAIINSMPHDIKPSSLKRCNSSPSLPADLESLPSELVLVRPPDSRHEENDLKLLAETLKTPVLQQVFCSLLLERKVILVSCVLSKLSSCIEALQIILYPFSWQHTIIPVLPKSLWEIVDTPTPLVCGVLSTEVVNEYKIDNAIVVDLDIGSVLLQVGDEDKVLPCCLINTLKDGLNLAYKMTSSKSGTHNVFLSDAFLRVFIQSCGHYKDFIIERKFEKSNFIKHSKRKGKRLRQFLVWFTETTMFHNFLDVALNESSSLRLFDQRIKIYSSDSATEILNKMKYWTNYKSLVSSNLNRFQ